MKKLEVANLTTLTSAETVVVNGGGATEEYGKDAGRALAGALTFGPLVAYYQFFTDIYYGV